jgi:hypothetical protein
MMCIEAAMEPWGGITNGEGWSPGGRAGAGAGAGISGGDGV